MQRSSMLLIVKICLSIMRCVMMETAHHQNLATIVNIKSLCQQHIVRRRNQQIQVLHSTSLGPQESTGTKRGLRRTNYLSGIIDSERLRVRSAAQRTQTLHAVFLGPQEGTASGPKGTRPHYLTGAVNPHRFT